MLRELPYCFRRGLCATSAASEEPRFLVYHSGAFSTGTWLVNEINSKSSYLAVISSAVMSALTVTPQRNGPELFIGLVAAVGTDHSLLTEILEDILHSFGYETKVIRLAGSGLL